jgi:putative urate catabolism protein
MTEPYPRDMVGYGREPPDADWPGGAYLALQIVLNYEEGGENCVLHGDPAAEAFLSEITGAVPLQGVRHMNMESIYEYGSRAGFWRVWRVMTERRLPLTVYGVAMAMDRNREACAAMREAGWEIASHGLRWIDYQHVPLDEERAHMREAIRLHTKLIGERPLGWYTGRCSPNTLRLVVEEGGFVYAADSYADDLPYWAVVEGHPQLIVPYTLDANDMRFCIQAGYTAADQFETYLKDSFDALYEEGRRGKPKMMSVGLHCRLVGRPGRIGALQRFLDHVQRHDRVWICRRIEIARHWQARHPFPGAVRP